MNEHGIEIENGTLRFSRHLPGPIERVWDWLTKPELRRKWFAGGPMDLRVGGRVELHFDHREMECPSDDPPPRYANMNESEEKSVGVITRLEPPHVLAYTWEEGEGESEVTFELSEENEGVRLVLIHRRLEDDVDLLAGAAAGWHTHTGILEDLLAEREAQPFWAVHTALEDRLRERLREPGA